MQQKTTVNPGDQRAPDMKTCSKIIEKKAVWRRREERKEKGGGGLQWDGSGSSDTLKLQPLSLSLSLCVFTVPQSLGTAASQILVLNDVRNMAFWRATASAQLRRPSLRLTVAVRLQAQKHGTVSHWHLSIRRTGGEIKSCLCGLWIP